MTCNFYISAAGSFLSFPLSKHVERGILSVLCNVGNWKDLKLQLHSELVG